jgi:hypothetical protein
VHAPHVISADKAYPQSDFMVFYFPLNPEGIEFEALA